MRNRGKASWLELVVESGKLDVECMGEKYELVVEVSDKLGVECKEVKYKLVEVVVKDTCMASCMVVVVSGRLGVDMGGGLVVVVMDICMAF